MTKLEFEFNLKERPYTIGQLLFTEDGHAFGPAIRGEDDYFEFFFCKAKTNEKDDSLQKRPQRITLREEISLNEPFLSYKLQEFDDRTLCLINLMKNCPQMSIALGDCQFVKFVHNSRKFAEEVQVLEMR